MTMQIIVPRALTLAGIDELYLDHDDTAAGTETHAFEACCGVVNRLLQEKGNSKRFTAAELLEGHVGQSFGDMAVHFARVHGFTLSRDELAEWKRREEDAVIAVLGAQAELAPGIGDFLTKVTSSGGPRMGLSIVSSSARRRLKACMTRTGLDRWIPDHRVFSAVDSLPEPKGKPHPDIYIHALRVTGTNPGKGLAIEDSPSGVRAAKAVHERMGEELVCLGYTGCLPPAKREARARALLEAGAVGVFDDWSELRLAS